MKPEGLEGLGLLYSVPCLYLNPIKSSQAEDGDIYVATEGWIEFEEINVGRKTVSGRFEFDAMLNNDDECNHPSIVEVRSGTFSNIPFELVIQE